MNSKPLSPEAANICFHKGTEPPFSGTYDKHFEPGVYHCVNCDAALFASDHKYDSGSGWPSFYDVAHGGALAFNRDISHGLVRTEVVCANCNAHMGHVFEDGPAPTGKRYCINSLALLFKPS